PVDSDEKTVTETGIDPVETASDDGSVASTSHGSDAPTKPARKSSKRDKNQPPQEHTETSSDPDNTVLELPPSPGQRKAKRRRNVLIGLVITTVLVAGGWALLFFSPILAIEEIQHEGLDLVTESEAAERTAELEGKPLPQVGERGVTELFEDNPAVDDVSLRAEPPHGL